MNIQKSYIQRVRLSVKSKDTWIRAKRLCKTNWKKCDVNQAIINSVKLKIQRNTINWGSFSVTLYITLYRTRRQKMVLHQLRQRKYRYPQWVQSVWAHHRPSDNMNLNEFKGINLNRVKTIIRLLLILQQTCVHLRQHKHPITLNNRNRRQEIV